MYDTQPSADRLLTAQSGDTQSLLGCADGLVTIPTADGPVDYACTGPCCTGPAIGDTIHRLGAAWNAGEITLAQAVAQLRALDPSLTQQGATAQIKAWRSAPSRYAAPAQDNDRLDQRRITPGSLRREPLVFRTRTTDGAA